MKTMPKPNNKKPWSWLDTETTGLDPTICPRSGEELKDARSPYGSRVLQVAVKCTDDALRPWTRGGRSEYCTDIKLPPEVLADASCKALEVNGFAEVVPANSSSLGRYLALPVRPLESRDGKDGTIQHTAPGTVNWTYGPGQEVNEDVLKEADALDNTALWVMCDPARWFDAESPEKAWAIVHTMLSGCHLVCQNIPFDRPHIFKELKLLNMTYPADRRGIEMMTASNLVAQLHGASSWGLELTYDTLAERMGMEKLSAHRASGDVDRMMAVYRFVRDAFMRGARLPE
jgi:hypothetical protein